MIKEHQFYGVMAIVGALAVGMAILLTLFMLQGYSVRSITEVTDEDTTEDIVENITVTETPEAVTEEETTVEKDPALEIFTLPTGTASYVLGSLDASGTAYVVDVVNAKTLETSQSSTISLDAGFRPLEGSRGAYYATETIQFDSSRHVYFSSTNFGPQGGNASKAIWRISRLTNAGTGETLVESKGNNIDRWRVSSSGEYIVYSVSDGGYTGSHHRLFRYDIATGENSQIIMNTPYNSNYEPFEDTYGPEFVDVVGDELFGVYTTEKNSEGLMYFRVNTENGIYTQTATTIKQDKKAINAEKNIALYWEADYSQNVPDKLQFLVMDLTKGTSFNPTTQLEADTYDFSLYWSPSGSDVTYNIRENGTNKLNVYNMDNGVTVDTNIEGDSVGSYGWFNDTEFLYFNYSNSAVGVYSLETKDNRLLPGGYFIPSGKTYLQ